MTRPVSMVEQLRVKITSGVLSINFIKRVKNIRVFTINTLVYFVDPKGVIGS